MEVTQSTQTDPVNPLPRIAPADTLQRSESGGLDSLGQGDFLRLLITQLEQQDPFDPVDNKDMLAQMAQFSSLAGTTESNATLQQIVQRLDTLIDAQTPAPAAPPAAPGGAAESADEPAASEQSDSPADAEIPTPLVS